MSIAVSMNVFDCSKALKHYVAHFVVREGLFALGSLGDLLVEVVVAVFEDNV
jgi:hypothetical protein